MLVVIRYTEVKIMKRKSQKILVCSLLSLFSLAACTTSLPSSSSSESSSQQDSSQSSSQEEVIEQTLTVTELLTTLKKLATEGVYDVEYTRNKTTYVDTLNTAGGYYWTEYPGYGYGYLPNFPGRKDAFFSWQYADGEITSVNREVKTDSSTYAALSEQPTMDDLNVFAALNSDSLGYLDEEYFTQTSSTKVTVADNNYFAIYMSILLNYSTSSSLDSLICNTTFTKDQQGYIHFAITTGSNHDIYNRQEYTGVIKNIGTAKNDDIAAAVKAYAFPTGQISTAAQKTLSLTAQEMDYTLYQTEIDAATGEGTTTTIANMRARYDFNKAFYCTYSTSTIQDAQVYLKFVDTKSYTLTTKALDAKTGLATDSFVRSIGDYTYTTLKLFTPAGCLDTSCFYGSGNEYKYYGGNDAISLYFLTSECLSYLIYGTTTITAKTDSDGNIEKMTAVSSGFQDSETGNALVYTVDFTFKELESNAFPEPEGKKDTAETLAFKEKYIDGKLDGTGNVKIEAGSDKTADKAEYIEADGILYIHRYGYDGSYDEGYTLNPAKDTYTGYKYDEEAKGLTPFTLTKNDDGTFSVASVGYLKNGTIASNFKPFSFASSLIQSTSNENEYKIVLNELVNLGNALLFDNNMQYVVNMESTSSLIYLEDMSIKTDGEYITSASYEIAYNITDDDGKKYPGTVYEQKYTYNVSQDANVVAAVASIKAKDPLKSWQEESSDIWQGLVSLLGAEEAANIPYLFHEQISGEWKFISSGTLNRLYVTQDEEFYDDDFYTEYGSLLVEKGWTKLEDYTEHQTSGEIVTHHYYQDEAGTVITFSDSRGWAPFFDIYPSGTWKDPRSN